MSIINIHSQMLSVSVRYRLYIKDGECHLLMLTSFFFLDYMFLFVCLLIKLSTQLHLRPLKVFLYIRYYSFIMLPSNHLQKRLNVFPSWCLCIYNTLNFDLFRNTFNKSV